MRCAEEELADFRSREFERMEACERRAEEAVARNEERDARILAETEAWLNKTSPQPPVLFCFGLFWSTHKTDAFCLFFCPHKRRTPGA